MDLWMRSDASWIGLGVSGEDRYVRALFYRWRIRGKWSLHPWARAVEAGWPKLRSSRTVFELATPL